MKKNFKKGLLSLMAASLVFSLIPPCEGKAESDSASQKEKAESKKQTEKPTEMVSERTENEKVFDNHDGSFTKQIFSEPIHMEEDGKLKEIDPVLEQEEKSDVIQPKQTKLEIEFLEKMDNGAYQKLTKPGAEVVFALKGAKQGDKEIDAQDQTAKFKENEVTYQEVLPKTDLRHLTFNRSVKEDLVLQEQTEADTFVYQIETKLAVTKEENGDIVFRDAAGKVKYTLPKPILADSNVDEKTGEAATTDQSYFELKKLTKTVYQLELKVDMDWLRDEKRVYPVYVDPSIRLDEIYNANVNSARPNENNIGSKLWDSGQNAYTLKLGKWDNSTGNNGAFLKMDTSTLQKATISKATLKMYNIWHMSPTLKNDIWVYETSANWSPWQVNWNNQPKALRIGQVSVGRGQWAAADVTGTVQAWASGTRPNYGFRLGTNIDQNYWKKIVASENNTNYPYLEVTYSYNKPAKPTVQGFSNGVGTGTGYFDVSWPAVSGATGYEVIFNNGKEDFFFSAGKNTSWTSKGKKIFPTQAEINAGAFEFHQDGKGQDFMTDPRAFYENGFEYYGSSWFRNQTRYTIRVRALYPGGESPYSDVTSNYLPLEKQKIPNAKAYSNLANKNSGYVELNWDKDPLADGYQVLMFNGKVNQTFDVGNVTKWTTQGKGIWPTKTEIEAGEWTLHTDGKGTELARDPSPVYKNSGGVYQDRKNYWFRIVSYQNAGNHKESIKSEPATPQIPEVLNKQLGMSDYWMSIPVRGGEVNATNGNFLFHETDFNIEGRGPSINIDRTFNSQDEQIGLFGYGWTSTLEEKLIEEPNGDVLWVESDKKSHRFKKKDGKYVAPAGIYSELSKTAEGYLKVEEDKSETRFLADGRLSSEKDTSGNVLSYLYSSGLLTGVKDASGRAVNFTYQDGLISKMTGPEGRTITYSYNDKQELMSSSTARGKLYRYGYTDGNLTTIYDPKHTEEKPYQTTFDYEDKKLVGITDPVGKKTGIVYDEAAQTATLTNEKKKKTVYEYNDAGNPRKEIVDADGLKLTTSYTYESNNLIKEVSPKGQTETYKYDADGNIIETTDPYGTEKFTYNKNNDVTSETDTEGRKTTVAYDGADAVSETLQTEANRSSVTQYDAYGNAVRGSGELAAAHNLVKNSGFEEGITNWAKTEFNGKGTISHDASQSAPGALGGSGALKIVSEVSNTDRGYTSAIQWVDVEPETTYTFSAWTKAENMTKSDGMLIARKKDASGKDITDASVWVSNRPTSIKSNSGWVKRQFTFKTSKATRQVVLYLQNEQAATGKGRGTVWYDKVQFEKGSSSSSFNPALNGSFEEHTNQTAAGWTRTGNASQVALSIVDIESSSGDSAVQMERKATTDAPAYLGQFVKLNQKVAKPITITGMSKSENVKANGSTSNMVKDYSVWGDVMYQDGTKEYVQAPLPLGTNDWNRSAVVVRPAKPIKEIKLNVMFRGALTGKAWFDDFRIAEGEVLTRDEYDADGNYVTASFDEEGRKISFSYDAYGNKQSEVDEKGHTKRFEYDADNALTKTTLANGTAVSYKYDDNGNTTEKFVTADGVTQENKFVYDVDNKNTEFVDALGRKIVYDYDAAGNETKATMPNGRVTESTYDSADRVNGVKWNGENAFRFQYDPNGNQTKVTDDVNGLVTDKVYDDADRIMDVKEHGGSVSYAYKDKPTASNKGKTDKVESVSISHGAFTAKTMYAYNDLDQNTRVNDGSKNAYFEFDEFGNIGVYTAGNETAANYSYDSTQKVTNVSIGTKEGEAILDESYTYDAASNRRSIDNKKSGKTLYEYDAVNQLTKETLPDGTVKSYAYDGFGNRTQVSISGSETKTIAASYNKGNQLVSWNGETLTYDENGNRVSDGKFVYAWDTGDRLASVTKKGESKPFATYTYDDDNRRLSKTVDGVVTNYHYDGDSIDVLYETDASGKVTRQYVYSDNNVRLAMKMNGKTLTYHYNAHGDVVALTDEAGKVVAKYAYDAWGNVLSNKAETTEAKANPYGYAGYTYDAELGQYYLMARYYEPKQGVFTAYDPDPGDEDDPQTMNGYNYANNNPVMFVDPDGHWIWLAINAGFAAYDGYKAYKKSKSWKKAGWAAIKGAIGGGKLKAAKKALRTVKVIGKRKFRRKFKQTKIPLRARRFIRYYEGKGRKPKGYSSGKFSNKEKKLPTKRNYTEFDIYRKNGRKNKARGNRGRQRLVRSNNGKWYYTNNHYGTFRKVRRW
ncbi:DNRLRE domain-containing protein [Listeria aquatica]|uniref:DNRLRE domain-containing protein n=1 Tax=Listeria aquatica TaxID=1494960 RepID=A0A841ZLR1_9LIST|nr:DNRLRE domain-containing protein [Listeria aquatica]MBC1521206.1 DNRLRE domain-containing protein [Listeria aquatica]